jgi:oxygen-independent coproporphyrinogen-3 oxidase
LTLVNALIVARHVNNAMLAKDVTSGKERAAYTSYPTAPHFVPSIAASTYASWLDDLSKPDAVSLYSMCRSAKNVLYCGCHTKATRRFEPVEAYVERLLREINLLADRMGCRRIVHLHWGGGTPSIVGPERLRELVTQLDVRFDLTALREHAFELDPRYVTKALAGALADIGVTRASLGVQDLSAHVQQAIGRVQPFSVVQQAVDTLREVGINEINIDLMYGLPNQSCTTSDEPRRLRRTQAPAPRRVGYAHIPWFKRHQRL